MTVTFESARVPDWESKDYLILSINPSYLATISTALTTAATLREILGDVRFLILAPDSTGKPTIYGAPWLAAHAHSLGLENLDWRPMTVEWRD